MTRSKKLLVAVSGLMAATVMVMSMDITVQAGKNENCLSGLSGGVAMIMDPGNVSTGEVIHAKTMELDVKNTDVRDDKNFVMANVKGALNVRSEASERSEKVGKLYKDCGGIMLEQKDGWTKIQTGNLVGWVKDPLLLFGDDARALATDVGKMTATIETDALWVREEPNSEAATLGTLPEGEVVEVINSDDEEWICVDFGGVDGYIAAEYVSTTFQVDTGKTMDELTIKKSPVMNPGFNRDVKYSEYLTDEETRILLAALIHCEAGGESYEGQVAVGAVVMNRVRSAAYPNTIAEVIYASGQFTPAMTGKVGRVIDSGKIYPSCFLAADEALAGTSNVGDLTHFRRVNGREGLIIGNHVFY